MAEYKYIPEPDCKCPYCGYGWDADHERFYDNEAEVECPECLRLYRVVREISFSFEAVAVPCLNDKRRHRWRKMDNGMEKCKLCDEQRGKMSEEYLRSMGIEPKEVKP